MKIYNALIKKTSEGKIEDIVLLKEGFSFSAFFFSGFWFLYHKMWKEFFVLAVINILFIFFAKISSDFDKASLEIAFLFIIALNANYWLCEHLKNKNYEFIGLVFGDNESSAKLRFIKNFEADYKVNPAEFDDSIMNPKLHRKMMKLRGKSKFSAA